jgi:hypothetical protein
MGLADQHLGMSGLATQRGRDQRHPRVVAVAAAEMTQAHLLRLHGHHAGAQVQEDVRSVAQVRADVEAEVAGLHELAVQPRDPGAPPATGGSHAVERGPGELHRGVQVEPLGQHRGADPHVARPSGTRALSSSPAVCSNARSKMASQSNGSASVVAASRAEARSAGSDR